MAGVSWVSAELRIRIASGQRPGSLRRGVTLDCPHLLVGPWLAQTRIRPSRSSESDPRTRDWAPCEDPYLIVIAIFNGCAPVMLTHISRWSHARGNEVVPSRWQATLATLGFGRNDPC